MGLKKIAKLTCFPALGKVNLQVKTKVKTV